MFPGMGMPPGMPPNMQIVGGMKGGIPGPIPIPTIQNPVAPGMPPPGMPAPGMPMMIPGMPMMMMPPPNNMPGFVNPPPMMPAKMITPTPPAVTAVIPANDQIATKEDTAVKEKKTKVMVGRINEKLDDEFMKQLLGHCDTVVEWIREKDSSTSEPQGFGYCEFESAQGVWRALKLLLGRILVDKDINIKCEPQVLRFVDQWKSSRKAEFEEKQRRNLNAEQVENLLERECEVAKKSIEKMVMEKNRELGDEKTEAAIRQEEYSKMRAERRAADQKARDELNRYRPTARERARIERWRGQEIELDREYQKRIHLWERESERKQAEWNRELGSIDDAERQRMIDRDLNWHDKEESEATRQKRRRKRKREMSEERKDREYEEAEARKVEEERKRQEQQLAEEEARREQQARREQLERQRKIDEEKAAKESAERAAAKAVEPQSSQKSPNPTDSAGQSAAPQATPSKEATREKKMEDTKALIAQIPTDSEKIFAFELDWNLMKQTHTIEKKLRPWVRKKVIEYLGAEEQGMIDYIINKVNAVSSSAGTAQKVSPASLLTDLREFLDDDAETFVIKMWRMIIFEYLRVKN